MPAIGHVHVESLRHVAHPSVQLAIRNRSEKASTDLSTPLFQAALVFLNLCSSYIVIMAPKKAVIISTSQGTYPNSSDKTGVW